MYNHFIWFLAAIPLHPTPPFAPIPTRALVGYRSTSFLSQKSALALWTQPIENRRSQVMTHCSDTAAPYTERDVAVRSAVVALAATYSRTEALPVALLVASSSFSADRRKLSRL